MLTVTKKPEKVVLAGDSVVFKLNSDSFLSAAGSKPFWTMKFIEIYANEYFEIWIGAIKVRITAVAAITDDSGTQFLLKEPMQTVSSWIDQTIVYLKENYVLVDNFEISKGYDTSYFIKFEARVKSDMEIILGTTTLTEYDFQLTDGSNEVMRDFYGVIFQSWIENNGINVKNSDVTLPVDSDGNVLFDVGAANYASIEPAFEFPDVSITKKQSSMLKKFFVRYAETYMENDEILIKKLYTSDYFIAIGGKIAEYKQNEFYNDNSGFFAQLGYHKRFLNWHPGNKTICRNQCEKLYYLFFQSFVNTEIELIIDVFIPGQNNDSIELTFTANQWEVFEFNLNTQLYNINADADYFEFYLKANSQIISERKRYYLDETDYPNKRLFLFKNSLDCYETMLFTGIRSHTSSFKREFAEMVKPMEFTSIYRNKRQVNINNEEKFKINSGWLTLEELYWTNEILSSSDVFELINNKLHKVTIINSDAKKDIDNEFNYSIEIEYTYDAAGYIYPSDALINPGDFNADFNNDFEI